MNANEKLLSLRKEKGLSQLELAEALNVSRQAVSRWEVGASVPSMDNLAALSRLYGVPLEDLLDDSVQTEPHGRPDGLKLVPLRWAVLACAAILLLAAAAVIGVWSLRPQAGGVKVTDISALACEKSECIEVELDLLRQSSSLEWTVPAGRTKQDRLGFFLEAGEAITIDTVFAPMGSEVDFGLIGPDGLFHYMDAAGGGARQTIQVNTDGMYYFAIRNDSKDTVTVMGFVYERQP